VGLRLSNLDGALSLSTRHRPPGEAARICAALASPWAATVEGLAAALALRASGRPGLAAAVSAPTTLIVGQMIKRLVSRPRPGLARFTRTGRQSFPSTHVAAPVALLACLWRLAPRTAAWRAVLGLGGVLALVVARERVCAGEHRASDIAAGAVLGAVMGSALGGIAVARRAKATASRATEGGLQECPP
jgi:membrane-associated phospholipid phosphatase